MESKLPKTVLVPIEESTLTPFEDNTRAHNAKNLEAIDSSVAENGFLRSIAVAEDGTILAGHGTYEVAKKRGAKLQFVDVDDDNVLIVVRKKGLTSDVAKARANLWDNKASDLSSNDKAAIRRLATRNPAQRLLKGIFSEKDEKRLMSAQADAQALAPGGSEEVVIERRIVPQQSNVKMVQIMLTTDTHPEFTRKAYALGIHVFNNRKNINDIIFELVHKAYDEWVAAPEEKAATV